MTAVSLAFNGIQLNPITHNNQIWLTSVELAKSLGYAHENGVRKIYNRHKDEFTDGMTAIVSGGKIDHATKSLETQNGSLVDSIGSQRIFSLRGCHLIAMFAKTVIAKQFRVWVLDILDKEVGQPKPYGLVDLPVSPFVTSKEKLLLRTAIEKHVAKTKESHSYYWHRLHHAYHVSKLEELPTGKVDEMLTFLGLRVPQLDEMVLVKRSDLVALEYQQGIAQAPERTVFKDRKNLKTISIDVSMIDIENIVKEYGGIILYKDDMDKIKGVLNA